jgi:hypothetical protein
MTVLLSTIFLGMPTLALHYDFWRAIIPPILPSFSLYSINPTLAYLLPLSFSIGLITLGISRDTGLRQTLTNLRISLPTSQKN